MHAWCRINWTSPNRSPGNVQLPQHAVLFVRGVRTRVTDWLHLTTQHDRENVFFQLVLPSKTALSNARFECWTYIPFDVLHFYFHDQRTTAGVDHTAQTLLVQLPQLNLDDVSCDEQRELEPVQAPLASVERRSLVVLNRKADSTRAYMFDILVYVEHVCACRAGRVHFIIDS